MIFLAMPVGSSHGWGICGKYISRELFNITGGNVRLITHAITAETVGDELEARAITETLCKPEDVAGAKTIDGVMQLDGPLLACVVDKKMWAWSPGFRGKKTVGYTFFEENVLKGEWMENARRNFDVVATGSTWCTNVLQQNGLANVQTVIQGVDGRIFSPASAEREAVQPRREFLKDRFVIFSGGKFEYRKGQDIVIRAVKVMQERHGDVVLVNAWFNPWQNSFDTMKASPHLRWPQVSGAFVEVMNQLLAENGLDMRRVVTLGPRPNALMARIYHNSDVGIFPNRCEGGTNLVLMEYMACGKPVVATASTGHGDVVRAEHAVVIGTKGETTINGAEGVVAHWPEPDLEEAVEKLEWVYQHRAEAGALGAKAGEVMGRMTWEASARGFERLLVG